MRASHTWRMHVTNGKGRLTLKPVMSPCIWGLMFMQSRAFGKQQPAVSNANSRNGPTNQRRYRQGVRK
eukprot:5184707-Pleurochrysis_carterae.AAC.3